MQLAQRMQAVQAPIIPVVAELIRQTPGTISLGQGVVFYEPPPQIYTAVQELQQRPDLHKYQPVYGVPALVEQIAGKLRIENGIEVGQDNRIVVTAGGNMAFMNAVLALCDPGDEVILPAPYYFNHEMAITMANCTPVLVPTDANYQLQPDLIAAAITPKTRALVTVSPNNPTGAVYPEQALRAVNELCRARGLYHISDEAYEYFTYDDARHFSPASIAGSGAHTLSLYSLSKGYGFASWRIGWMVIPEHLFEAVNKVQDTILICPPVVSQLAALSAMQVGRSYSAAYLAQLAEVRLAVLRELAQLAPHCQVPPAEGAFYFYLKLATSLPPLALVERLIREFRVAAIPGNAFGSAGCYLRISYGALQPETVRAGVGRLVHGVKTILGE
ncbi:MAG: pyridoxal phosphate-dependent aminotransferase [Acidobacteria bacterium]|nr:pyridoxal phosphate-dependent aminotransferase [Acidobacteriota bacterium]MBI3421488.1 pyridoxal phosphate-dependent aminotransferase [Acidobacteriota bacterium]